MPLLLLLGAAATGRLWDRDIRFFAAAFVVLLLYALGWYTPAFRAMYEVLPGVSLYRRPADAVFLIGALAAILAGYGAHSLFRAPWERLQPASGVTVGKYTYRGPSYSWFKRPLRTRTRNVVLTAGSVGGSAMAARTSAAVARPRR